VQITLQNTGTESQLWKCAATQFFHIAIDGKMAVVYGNRNFSVVVVGCIFLLRGHVAAENKQSLLTSRHQS
jgi:hypothetical protein